MVNLIPFFISPRARPEDDGRTFECSAHNPTIEEPHARAAKVNLVVLCESGFGGVLTAAKQTRNNNYRRCPRTSPGLEAKKKNLLLSSLPSFRQKKWGPRANSFFPSTTHSHNPFHTFLLFRPPAKKNRR